MTWLSVVCFCLTLDSAHGAQGRMQSSKLKMAAGKLWGKMKVFQVGTSNQFVTNIITITIVHDIELLYSTSTYQQIDLSSSTYRSKHSLRITLPLCINMSVKTHFSPPLLSIRSNYFCLSGMASCAPQAMSACYNWQVLAHYRPKC